MRVETIKCDLCNKEKGEANHWWSVWYDNGASPRSYIVAPLCWTGVGDPTQKKLDICSESCLNVAEQRIRDGKDPVQRINKDTAGPANG